MLQTVTREISIHSRPDGHVLVPVAAIGGLSLALCGGLSLLGPLERVNAMIAERLGVHAWDEDDEFKGRDAWIPGGLDRLIDALATGVDVRFGQVVEHLDPRGVVRTQQGTWAAEHVVVRPTVQRVLAGAAGQIVFAGFAAQVVGAAVAL